MRKLLVITLVLVFAFAFAIPVSAGNGTGGSGNGTGGGTPPQGPRGTFALTGTIAAIGTDTVTIQAMRGNKLVQPLLGTQISVTVNLQTRYLFRAGTISTAITLADLKVGQPVSVNGRVANNIWTASRITVGASLSCLP